MNSAYFCIYNDIYFNCCFNRLYKPKITLQDSILLFKIHIFWCDKWNESFADY